MAVTVKIPPQLRSVSGGEAETEVDGATVQEVLDGLFARFDELRVRISDDDGSLRRFVNVYVAGEDIRFLDGLQTPVSDGAELRSSRRSRAASAGWSARRSRPVARRVRSRSSSRSGRSSRRGRPRTSSRS